MKKALFLTLSLISCGSIFAEETAQVCPINGPCPSAESACNAPVETPAEATEVQEEVVETEITPEQAKALQEALASLTPEEEEALKQLLMEEEMKQEAEQA